MPDSAVQLTDPSYTLAEGPVWDPARKRVLWVDIEEGLVLVGRFEGERLTVETEHRFEAYVGPVVVADDGSILVAETRTLTRVAPDGTRTSTGPFEMLGPEDRFNDGLCDARGRFLVGTCSFTGIRHSQHLLQVGPEGTRVLDDDLGLANGLAFSPDGGTLYSVDSVPGRIWRRDYDHDTGATGERSLLFDVPDGTPDGLTVDATGRLWVAIYGRGEVRCLKPDGTLVERLEVPAPRPTCPVFVGDDLDRLVVTTAREGMDEQQLAASPLSGSLFLVTPGASGLPAFPWSGHLPL